MRLDHPLGLRGVLCALTAGHPLLGLLGARLSATNHTRSVANQLLALLVGFSKSHLLRALIHLLCCLRIPLGCAERARGAAGGRHHLCHLRRHIQRLARIRQDLATQRRVLVCKLLRHTGRRALERVPPARPDLMRHTLTRIIHSVLVARATRPTRRGRRRNYREIRRARAALCVFIESLHDPAQGISDGRVRPREIEAVGRPAPRKDSPVLCPNGGVVRQVNELASGVHAGKDPALEFAGAAERVARVDDIVRVLHRHDPVRIHRLRVDIARNDLERVGVDAARGARVELARDGVVDAARGGQGAVAQPVRAAPFPRARGGAVDAALFPGLGLAAEIARQRRSGRHGRSAGGCVEARGVWHAAHCERVHAGLGPRHLALHAKDRGAHRRVCLRPIKAGCRVARLPGRNARHDL